MDYIRKLAVHHRSVTDLQFYALEAADVIAFHYRIWRDAQGRVTAMAEVLKNGTCSKEMASRLGVLTWPVGKEIVWR